MVVKDSIVFQFNGKEQDIDLISYGQDVNLINGEIIGTETWNSPKPYLVYNSMLVDTNSILTLEAGSKIFFHKGSRLFVAGTIVVNGTSTYTLDLGSCSEIVSVYNLTSGPAITGQDFTVTSGFDTACVYSGGTLPVEEYTFLSKNLKVYPNPLNSGNTINLLFGLPIDAKLTMYSITGKEVFNEVLENTDRKDINVSNLSNGIYLLKLSTEKSSITRKVVILK